MGLCGSIPLILKERKVSYEGLSLFSLVSLPFSLKIIWAPIVDTFYLTRSVTYFERQYDIIYNNIFYIVTALYYCYRHNFLTINLFAYLFYTIINM